MNHNKIKTLKHYFKRFLTWSFNFAGSLFFSLIFVAMITIPTIKSTDISHNSQIFSTKIAEAIQMSLGFWQFMFWLPIIVGLMFTIVEGLLSYSKTRNQLRNTVENNVGEVKSD